MTALQEAMSARWRSLRHRLRPVGLQRRIMLYVSAGLLVFSAIYAWVALQAVQESSELVFRERLLAARAIAREVDVNLGHLQAELQEASTQLAPALAVNDLNAINATLDHLSTHWVAYHHFEPPCSIRLVDAHGAILWSQPGSQPAGQGALPRAAWQAASGSQQALIFQDTAGDGAGDAMVTFAVPVRAADADSSLSPSQLDAAPPAAPGQTLGYLINEIDLAHIGPVFESELTVVDPGYQVELIDGSGLIISSNAKSRVLSASHHRDLVAPLLRAGQAGVRTHTFEANGTTTSHVVAFAPLTLIQWGVIVEQEEDEALSLPRHLQIQFFGFGLFALFGGLLLAWATTWRVVQPVNALTDATQAIARGNLDLPLDMSGSDEVATLARSFDEMRVKLKQSREEIASWNRELEARVQQRTRELAALVESSNALTSTLELAALFEILMKETIAILPAAEGIMLFLWENETRKLAARSTLGFDASACANLRFESGEAIGGRVFEVQAPTLLRTTEDVMANQNNLSAENREYFNLALDAREVKSALGVPLRSKGERLGALVLYNFTSEAAFAESDVPALQALADQAAAAIENARLYEQAGEVGALRELNRLKSEFVTRASHELRTPLTAVKSLAETLLRPDLDLDDKTQREFLEGIDNASDRLNEIVKQLLMLARVEAGRLEIKRERVDLSGLVTRVGARFRVQAPNRVIEVSTEEALPYARGDPDRIEDVLTNLISNALKYSAPPAAVTVQALASGDQLIVSVSDVGIGIPPDARERIFEPFYRVDNSVTRQAGGAGLGLHLAKTYVEAMGGTIRVGSEQGRGSVFSFSLPRADPLHSASPTLRSDGS